MHVVFISNCDHKALTRTRSLLDRYANRIGDRAWGSLITQAALNEVQQALKRRATRQTSVACYRSDSALGLRLIWVAGNRGSYDSAGRFAVATRRKARELPLAYRHAALVAELAGYAHDLGKASAAFQQKLHKSCDTTKSTYKSDVVRHEWLSAVLLRDLLGQSCIDSLALSDGWKGLGKRCSSVTALDRPPIEASKSAEDAALWSVLTHHGAVGCTSLKGRLSNAEHVKSDGASDARRSHFFRHAELSEAGNEQDRKIWSDLLARMGKLRDRLSGINRSSAYWEGVMLAARAALIVADHKVSSLPYEPQKGDPVPLVSNDAQPHKPAGRAAKGAAEQAASPPALLYANTKRRAGDDSKRTLDQPLSWHLREVGESAQRCVRMIGSDELPGVDSGLVSSVLQSKAPEGSAFAWQDKASDSVAGFKGGQLVFNVASTGAGKTLANLKIAFAMRPKRARLAVAFNLRSLTAQTFDAYREHLSCIDKQSFERDFACLMGERVDYDPEKHAKKVDDANVGNQDEDRADAEGELDLHAAAALIVPDWLQNIAPDRGNQTKAKTNLQQLIAAPVLVSTVDWIIAAGEPGQQARHAKALMRLSSSDLVLDEVDSYDATATVSLARLVQTAASFGRNVVVSSATLNPKLADLLVRAYAAGHRVAKEMLGLSNWRMSIVSNGFDPVRIDNPDVTSAAQTYCDTMSKMANDLAETQATKRFVIAAPDFREPYPIDQMAKTVIEQAKQMHEAHGQKLPSHADGPRLSIGLVRVANVSTCQDLAERLRASGDFVVCAYHARDTIGRRKHKEHQLDRVLNRKKDSRWEQALLEVCPWIKDTKQSDVRLIVVATPVEEVGRDHDFDYAIIEPSSMHSIVQTAGRVNRHRQKACDNPNVAILSLNMRALSNRAKGENGRVFYHPGLEVEDPDSANHSTHSSHDIGVLLAVEGNALDASLVFGERTTKFAQCDERGIELQTKLALPIIARDPSGGGQCINLGMHFLTSAYAEKFSLRNGDKAFDFRIKGGWLRIRNASGNGWIDSAIPVKMTMEAGSDEDVGLWLHGPYGDDAQDGASLQLPSYCVKRIFQPKNGAPKLALALDWRGLVIEGGN